VTELGQGRCRGGAHRDLGKPRPFPAWALGVLELVAMPQGHVLGLPRVTSGEGTEPSVLAARLAESNPAGAGVERCV